MLIWSGIDATDVSRILWLLIEIRLGTKREECRNDMVFWIDGYYFGQFSVKMHAN